MRNVRNCAALAANPAVGSVHWTTLNAGIGVACAVLWFLLPSMIAGRVVAGAAAVDCADSVYYGNSPRRIVDIFRGPLECSAPVIQASLGAISLRALLLGERWVVLQTERGRQVGSPRLVLIRVSCWSRRAVLCAM